MEGETGVNEIEVDGILYTQQFPKPWPACKGCAHDEHYLPCERGVCDCGHPVVKGLMGWQWWGDDDNNGQGQTGQNGSSGDDRSCSEALFGMIMLGLVVVVALCTGLGTVLTW